MNDGSDGRSETIINNLTAAWMESKAQVDALKAELAQCQSDRQREHDARCTAAGSLEATQSQAAAMAGLLEEARTEIMHWTGGHEATSTKSYLNNLLPRIDAALSAWKAGE